MISFAFAPMVLDSYRRQLRSLGIEQTDRRAGYPSTQPGAIARMWWWLIRRR